jgi:hypothetical protein
MKKIAFFVIVALFFGTAVWAQGDREVEQGYAFNLVGSTFDWFYADNDTASVEFSASAGIFSSRIDEYISVMSYDPEVGQFLFVGGNNDFSESLRQSGATFGYGRTLDSGYYALFFNGNFLTAEGFKDEDNSGDNFSWDSRFAFLWSLGEMGALRLDIQQIGDVDPTIAATWGGFKIKDLKAYATIGFDAELEIFGIQFGIQNEDGISADAAIQAYEDNFAMAFRGALYYSYEFEKFEFGFSPFAGFGFGVDSAPEDNISKFGIMGGIDGGLKIQIKERFQLYAGATLAVLEFGSLSYADYSEWGFYGFRWIDDITFGLTFAPIPNFMIGIAANVSEEINLNLNFAYKYDRKPKEAKTE